MADSTQIYPAPEEFNESEIGLDPILRYFQYAHLPETMKKTSMIFCRAAREVVDTVPRTPERTVALRKLLEAKDCAVRSHVN